MSYVQGPGDGDILPKSNQLKAANLGRRTSTGNYFRNSAVYIRNVYKRYDDGPPVIQDFCMNVRRGTIYGLLGSSGCGKTTILSCIVGLQQCDSGEMLVFGKEPGTKDSGIPGKRLGYMPQELALYNQLSVREIIQFYGRIYSMNSLEIAERWDFLNGLLELPNKFKLIGDLSGGQQRRVSLALALIHSPELIVLDEPTVGLDPLLRRNIWDHLYTIVRKLGTTIIITTHYIEEARLSNLIGVMRRGRLIAEDTPFNLLQNYNCELLEQAVLELCRKDEYSLKHLASTQPATQQDNKIVFRSPWKQISASALAASNGEQQTNGILKGFFRKAHSIDIESNQYSGQRDGSVGLGHVFEKITSSRIFNTLRRIYGQTTVILLTLMRNPAFLGLILFMPAIQGTITLLTIGSPPRNLKLGIVNHELANWTMECDSPENSGNSCDVHTLSCKYLNQLRSSDLLILEPYDNEVEALSQAHLGKIWGYLTFPDNYSQHTLDHAAAMQFAWNDAITGSHVHIHLDYSQFVQLSLIIKHLYASNLEFLKKLATDCDIGGRQAELPLDFRPPVYGKDEDDYTSFIIPGLILICLFGLGLGLAGMIIVADRKQGTLSRAHVAGLSTGDVLTGHMITQGIIAVGQIMIWNAILYFGFNFENFGSPWLSVLFCLMMAWCGSALGLFVGQICTEAMQVLFICIFLFTILMFFGCVLFPMERMSFFWKQIAKILPTTMPTLSLRSVTVRGFGITNPHVWSGLVVLLAWILILLLGSVITYKKFKK